MELSIATADFESNDRTVDLEPIIQEALISANVALAGDVKEYQHPLLPSPAFGFAWELFMYNGHRTARQVRILAYFDDLES